MGLSVGTCIYPSHKLLFYLPGISIIVSIVLIIAFSGFFKTNNVLLAYPYELSSQILPKWAFWRNLLFLIYAALFVLRAVAVKEKNKQLIVILNIKHLIGGVLLVQFSYAISGLIVDLIRVVIIASKL